MLGISKLAWRTFKPLVISTRGKYPAKFHQILANSSETNCDLLPNGIAVTTETRLGMQHACIGIFVNAGTRNESQFESGITSFFEHIVFRGTCCRPAEVLKQEMAVTGARFSSFTERELCGYYASCRSNVIPQVFELLADCVFNNRLDPEEIEFQKNVVYQEMEYLDEDDNVVLLDYLHGAAFMGTSLVNSVAGQSHNLLNFRRESLASYLGNFFIPERTVLVAVGGIDHRSFLTLARNFVGNIKPRGKCYDANTSYRFTAGDVRFRDDAMPYCHVAVGFEAPRFGDERAYTLKVAEGYLGGWDSSMPGGPMCAHRLARAAHTGMAHSYSPFYFQYSDTGLFGYQLMTKGEDVECFFQLAAEELMGMCLMATENELQRAKHEIKAHMLTRNQNVELACIDLGKWTTYCGQSPTISEKLEHIDYVTVQEFQRILCNFCYDKCFAIAAVGPTEQLLHYPRIRACFYMLRL